MKTLAVGDECPLFSHQNSCRFVAHAQFTRIQIRIQQTIYKTRLKHLHFRQLPRLTASKPLPHEVTSCVQQLRRKFQCDSNQPSSSVQLLVCFVADLTVSQSPRTPQSTRNSEPSNCRTVVCERTRCPRTLLTRQNLMRFAVFVLQAAHAWTEA